MGNTGDLGGADSLEQPGPKTNWVGEFKGGEEGSQACRGR